MGLTAPHLYIHVPFCASRCGYCDFFSRARALELAPAYVGAVLAELEAETVGSSSGGPDVSGPVAGLGAGPFETVYAGGGTPTLLGPDLLGRLLAPVFDKCQPGAEITVEANPSTLTPALAGGLAAAGVNRVSLGVQSFDPGLRRNLGRQGPVEAVGEAVRLLRGAGIGNIGLDLMFSIPGQTLTLLARDLDSALRLEPEHISCYELTVKAGSAFAERWRRELREASRSGRAFYESAARRLTRGGYRWYETSNFALPGRECRHNLAYWNGEDYLGLGAGAWSTVAWRRWRNTESIEGYIAACGNGGCTAARDVEELDVRKRLSERLLLGLRLDSGIERREVDSIIDRQKEKTLLRNGFLANEGGRISLTRQGRFVANEVCARLLRD